MLTCESSDALVHLRATFLAKLFTDLPNLRNQMAETSITEFLNPHLSNVDDRKNSILDFARRKSDKIFSADSDESRQCNLLTS
jgi:hypothetical protein